MRGATRWAAALLLLTLFASAGASEAQPYPKGVVRIVVPLSAGGITDIVARILADRLAARLGQPFIVENKVGAGGAVAAESVARADPDGYTLIMGTVSSHAINASLVPNLRYDNVKDFAPISLVAAGPNLLVVHPDVPAANVAELVALLKKHPGRYFYGSTGVGTSVHLLTELFKKLTGTQVTHVPYKGSAPMINDLLAGHVQIAFDNMPTALAQAQAGRLRALGVTSAERWPKLPDTPAVGETVPGFSGTSWQGLFAPAGTPAAIVDLLSREVRAILSDPEIRDRMIEMGTRPAGNTPEAFRAFVVDETRRWAELVALSGAQSP